MSFGPVDPVSASVEPGTLMRVAALPSSASAAAGGKPEQGGFSELVDLLNPLQHIPGVAQVYRSVTGDAISDSARAGGNLLYGLLGGPLGMIAMTAVTIVDQAISDRMAGPGGAVDAARSGPDAGMTSPSGGAPLSLLPEDFMVETVAGDASGDVESSEAPFLGVAVGRTGERLSGDRIPTLVPLPPLRPEPAMPRARPVLLSDPSLAPSPAFGTAEGGKVTLVPSQDSLDQLSSHSANILPLDVLQTLQLRHARLERL